MDTFDGDAFLAQFTTGGLSNRVSGAWAGGRAGRIGELTILFFLSCLALPGWRFWLQYIPDKRKPCAVVTYTTEGLSIHIVTMAGWADGRAHHLFFDLPSHPLPCLALFVFSLQYIPDVSRAVFGLLTAMQKRARESEEEKGGSKKARGAGSGVLTVSNGSKVTSVYKGGYLHRHPLVQRERGPGRVDVSYSRCRSRCVIVHTKYEPTPCPPAPFPALLRPSPPRLVLVHVLAGTHACMLCLHWPCCYYCAVEPGLSSFAS